MNRTQRLRDPFFRDVVMLLCLIGLFVPILWVFVQSVLAPTFEAEGLVYAMWSTTAAIFGSESTLLAAVVGVWLGIVTLWTIDTYKRPTSFFPLLVGVLCIVFLGVPSSTFSALTTLRGAGVFLLCGLATVQVGGVGVFQSLRGGRAIPGPPNEAIELRRGPRFLYLGTALAVGTIILDHHVTIVMADVAGSTSTFRSAIYGILILSILYPFVRYDERRRVVQIGPGRSGKTSTIGGMYSDIKSGSQAPSENRTGRELVGKQLQGISNRLTSGQSFPDKTENTGPVPFDYYDGRRLFRRKNVMMTFDYEGQKLTGEDGPDSFSGRLAKYRDRRSGRNSLSNIRERIEHTLGWGTEPWYAEFTKGAGDPKIARLLDSADTVVFTLPLDDFLTPTIKRGRTIPDEAGIYFIEPIQGTAHERYVVKRPWGSEFEVVRSTEGELVRSKDGDQLSESIDSSPPSCESDEFETVDGLSFDTFEQLPLAPKAHSSNPDSPERRYTTDKDRDPIETYLDEYQRLIELLWDRELRGWLDSSREFVWVMTMSDLVLEDFEEIYENVQQADGNNADTGSAKRKTQKYLKERGFFEEKKPALSRRDYTVFGQWIAEECIQRHIMGYRESHPDEAGNLPDIDKLIEQTGEDTVYPVWFDVARSDSGKLAIKETNERLLKGSNFLFDRIEGRPLPYPKHRRVKTSPVEYFVQRINPFTKPVGKPLYDSAVEEMGRSADQSSAAENKLQRTEATSDSEPEGRDGHREWETNT